MLINQSNLHLVCKPLGNSYMTPTKSYLDLVYKPIEDSIYERLDWQLTYIKTIINILVVIKKEKE